MLIPKDTKNVSQESGGPGWHSIVAKRNGLHDVVGLSGLTRVLVKVPVKGFGVQLEQQSSYFS